MILDLRQKSCAAFRRRVVRLADPECQTNQNAVPPQPAKPGIIIAGIRFAHGLHENVLDSGRKRVMTNRRRTAPRFRLEMSMAACMAVNMLRALKTCTKRGTPLPDIVIDF